MRYLLILLLLSACGGGAAAPIYPPYVPPVITPPPAPDLPYVYIVFGANDGITFDGNDATVFVKYPDADVDRAIARGLGRSLHLAESADPGCVMGPLSSAPWTICEVDLLQPAPLYVVVTQLTGPHTGSAVTSWNTATQREQFRLVLVN